METPTSQLLRSRRCFLSQSGLSLGAVALQALLGSRPVTAQGAVRSARRLGSLASRPPHFPAQATNVIYLFMAGGPSQLDMFDYKPVLQKLEGQPIPESFIKGKEFAQITEKQPKLMGTPYRFRRHGESGIEVSELLPYTASVVDDLAVIKTVKTTEFVHHLAELMLYTGTPRFGRPGLGAWVTYGLGSEAENLPGFVVLPGVGALGGMARTKQAVFSNGFLPSAYQGVPLRPVGEPILNVTDPPGVTRAQEQRLVDLINDMNQERLAQTGDPEIAARVASYEMAFRMQASTPELLDLRGESRATLALYGVDPDRPSFARNCLIARRLVERGVRFVQVILGDWDHHGAIYQSLPPICREMDQGCAALIKDLKARGLLDSTLVIWGGELGRSDVVQVQVPGQEKGSIGRDHHIDAFTVWMAGGGVRAGQTVGATDEIGFNPVATAVHVHDLQATILHLLGLDHRKLTYHFQGRDFRLTDVGGEIVEALVPSRPQGRSGAPA
jgi:Protein of unknown function (DUF1501)